MKNLQSILDMMYKPLYPDNYQDETTHPNYLEIIEVVGVEFGKKFFCPEKITDEKQAHFYKVLTAKVSLPVVEIFVNTMCGLGVGRLHLKDLANDRRHFVLCCYRLYEALVEVDLLQCPLLIETVENTRAYGSKIYEVLLVVKECVRIFRENNCKVQVTDDNVAACILSNYDDDVSVVACIALAVDSTQGKVNYDEFGRYDDNSFTSYFSDFYCSDSSGSVPWMYYVLLDSVDSVSMNFFSRLVCRNARFRFSRRYSIKMVDREKSQFPRRFISRDSFNLCAFMLGNDVRFESFVNLCGLGERSLSAIFCAITNCHVSDKQCMLDSKDVKIGGLSLIVEFANCRSLLERGFFFILRFCIW